MEQHGLKKGEMPTFTLTYRHPVVKVIINISMLLIFSTPVLIRHLWQLKADVFLHWCLIRAVIFNAILKVG